MAANGINGINYVSPVALTGFDIGKTSAPDNENLGVSFSDYLKEALNQANDLQLESEQIANDFAIGKTDNIHQVMIASEKADIALQFTMQIRNKILEAYNEIMRMQI